MRFSRGRAYDVMNRVILIVHHYEVLGALYAKILRLHGYAAQSVQSTEEAWSSLSQQKPQMLLIEDWAIDGWHHFNFMTAFELVQWVRKQRELADLPVVMLGNLVASEAESKRVGCDAFLLLPSNPDELVAVVDAVARP